METHLLLGGVLYHLVDTCFQGELCLLFVLHALVQSSDKIDFVLFHGFCCILCIAWAVFGANYTAYA